MSTPYVLLGLLASGPRHGHDLAREHVDRMPMAEPLSFDEVEVTLDELERDGLIERNDQDPDRPSYALTARGRVALDGWLGAVEPPVPHMTGQLFAKVVVALLAADSDRARTYLAAQRTAHMARIRELTVLKSGPTASMDDVVAADFAIGHLDSDLRWLHTTLDRVTDLHREVRA